MIHSGRISQSALRLAETSARAWRQPVRHVSTTLPKTSRPPSRWTRRLIYTGIFGTLGYLTGCWALADIIAPPLKPGSLDDKSFLLAIERMFNEIPLVLELRNNPAFEEKDVYDNFSNEQKSHRLTSGPLAGSKGLGFQRVFWNEKEKLNVSVVYLGRGLEGWPLMIHGGALATVIDENLGRIAIRNFPERTGVTANLNLDYRAPVRSDRFYILITSLDEEKSTDRKAYAKCQLKDMQGKVCVEASGLFVLPKKLKLDKLGEHF